MLAIIALLGVFYLYVLKTVATPHVDEAFRRTFITREFGGYPASPVFKGKDGLSYKIGTRVTFTDDDSEAERNLLSRFDWGGNREDDGPYLRAFRGRLFFHIEDPQAIAGKPLLLKLAVDCNFPADYPATVSVAAGSVEVGRFTCAAGHVEPEFTLPADRYGRHFYDSLTLVRTPSGLMERIATRLGLRADALQLVAFEIRQIGS